MNTDYVVLGNTLLLVLVLVWIIFIERKLAFVSNPLKEFSLLDDIQRMKEQQQVTEQELLKIRERVEETVQAMAALDEQRRPKA